jgi:2-C-methyl-D-erythritol 2,4-cyclodiphosphate synthase
MSFRIGTGFDAHRLVADRPLLLGGVRVPYERGLLGHSDGDCLLHAICDALLGAAGAGDLGRLFPSSDARYQDASSRLFLTEVARLIAGRFRVANVDATLIAQEPRLAPHTESMRIEIARM